MKMKILNEKMFSYENLPASAIATKAIELMTVIIITLILIFSVINIDEVPSIYISPKKEQIQLILLISY